MALEHSDTSRGGKGITILGSCVVEDVRQEYNNRHTRVGGDLGPEVGGDLVLGG